MRYTLKILFSESEIHEKVQKAGHLLSQKFQGQYPIFLSTLKGSVVFSSDLIRCVQIPLRLEFIEVSSYDGNKSSNSFQLTKEPHSAGGNPVCIVEDILDTGRTAEFLFDYLKEKGDTNVILITLLNKKEKNQIPCEFSLFDIADEFAVGYGMDYRQIFRNLPCIAVLTEEVQKLIDKEPENFSRASFLIDDEKRSVYIDL